MDARAEDARTTWTGIFQQVSPRRLDDGEALVVPSERLTRLFYLEKGRLRCSVVSENGTAKTLLYYWPGDICGAGKTLAMVDHIRQLRFLTVEARVADFLCRMSGQAFDRTLPFTHEEIADYVGAHRVSVTEALRNIERTGTIRTGRGHIVIRDISGLRRVAVG